MPPASLLFPTRRSSDLSILAIDSAMVEQAPYRGSVIYLGTLSKSVVPGLRVGWLVADPDLVQTLAVAKQSSDISSSMLTHALRSEEHTSELQSLRHLVCRLLLCSFLHDALPI